MVGRMKKIFACGFCDMYSTDVTKILKHWKKCPERIKELDGMRRECERRYIRNIGVIK